MWSGLGKFVASLLQGLVGGILGWFKQKKLKREASRGRAAKEFLKSEDEAKKEEDKQRKLQDDIETKGIELNEEDLFDLDH